jgi:hypothetical protein
LKFSSIEALSYSWHTGNMPKRTGKLDVVQNARRVLNEALERAGAEPAVNRSMISQVMAEMGRRGGQIGGKRRLETMTPEERKASAQAAITARWDKYRAMKKGKTS